MNNFCAWSDAGKCDKCPLLLPLAEHDVIKHDTHTYSLLYIQVTEHVLHAVYPSNRTCIVTPGSLSRSATRIH